MSMNKIGKNKSTSFLDFIQWQKLCFQNIKLNFSVYMVNEIQL